MIQALMLSFQSLSDKRVAALLAKVILLTIVVFIILGIGVWYAMDALFAWMHLSDDGTLSGLLSVALLLLSGILLFRVVAVAVTWIFADDIIDAVEDRHYPHHAELGKRPGLAAGMQMAARSVVRVIGYNLLALPIYLLLLFTGIGAAIVFILVARHGKAHGTIRKLPRLLLGLFGTAGMLIPFFNLVVPVLATAMAVHMVHSGVSKL
jgi:CysZ protein